MSALPRPCVHLVEDDPSLRQAISALLRSLNHDVATYGSAEEFLAAAPNLGLGCVLLDVHLPGDSGVVLQRALNQMGFNMPIVFLTGHGTIPLTVQVMKAGAANLLPKPFSDEELLNAVESAIAVDRDSWNARAAALSLRQRYESLSPRQREVFVLVVAGRLNKVIAAELNITEITVKVHRRHIMEKFEVRTVADLVRSAEKLGIEIPGQAAYTKV